MLLLLILAVMTAMALPIACVGQALSLSGQAESLSYTGRRPVIVAYAAGQHRPRPPTT